MIPPQLHTPKNGEILPLEVRHYGVSEGEFMLYDDDGETFNYENGEYSLTRLMVKKSAGMLKGMSQIEKEGIYNYSEINWVYMTK